MICSDVNTLIRYLKYDEFWMSERLTYVGGYTFKQTLKSGLYILYERRTNIPHLKKVYYTK